MEKHLLQARGVLSNAYSRSASLTPDSLTLRYVDELNERLVQAIEHDSSLVTSKLIGGRN